MWKRIKHVSHTDISTVHKDMRYFIYYPPHQSIRLIDVSENVLVDDVLTLVKKEFGLNTEDSGPSETSIVLNYNGSDLKPKWPLIDLSIPSGSIIRCLYREEKAADLYVYCSFNKQILKLYDSSMTMETNIRTVRKKISEKLGLPLSTFCLETYETKQRLYDDLTLMNYDIKIHDHIYLKVWRGYEKFINSCVKGFTEQYAQDDLTRHYQAQIAAFTAAFYGHMDLASYAIQQGARCDHPVGEHPSRQWSSETTTEALPEMLKCPIHVAVERGHIKIVDAFVRHSILCTQVRDPITNYLPYELALYYSLRAKSKEEEQRYRGIYFYLHDKQFNLRVPLNANGEYVSDLLTSTVSANAIHHTPSNFISVSLPLYYKIMSWYERAREKVWKKHGGHFFHQLPGKRIYPKYGLLGYKVLIDGYNNTFEVPQEQLRNSRSAGTSKANRDDRCSFFSEEEQEKINKMRSFMKHFTLDERKRAKQIAAENLQQARRAPIVSSPTRSIQNQSPKKTSQPLSTSLDLSNNPKRPKTSSTEIKIPKTRTESKTVSSTYLTSSMSLKLINDNHIIDEKVKRLSKIEDDLVSSSVSSDSPSLVEEENDALPVIGSLNGNVPQPHSSITNKLDNVINANKIDLQPMMPATDAYAFSSARIALETEQRRKTKKKELLAQIEQSVESQLDEKSKDLLNPLSNSFISDRRPLEIDTYIPLPDHPSSRRPKTNRSRLETEIHQATVRSYERHASATTRSTAIQCLQEAGYFKGKSWLKQVEISKEMMKHCVKRRISRTNQDINNKPTLLPLRTNIVATPVSRHGQNPIQVN